MTPFPARPALFLLLALCSPILGAESPFLKIDINAGTSYPQEGWEAFGWPTGAKAGPGSVTYSGLDPRWTASGTEGEVTFTLSAGPDATSTQPMLTRNRAAPDEATTGFPLSNVYRDFINTSNNANLWIGLSGLTPNTEFNITLYSFDFNKNRTLTFTDHTHGTAGTSGAIAWYKEYAFSADSPTDIFATTLPVRSDANGNLLIRDYDDNVNNPGLLSGLTLAAAPERAQKLDLRIDFGIYNASIQHSYAPFGVTSGTATGPVQFSYSGLDPHTTSGTLTLTLAGGNQPNDPASSLNARDRSAPAAPIGTFTLNNLYRDTVINRTTNQPLWLDITGFLPNQTYALQLFSYDDANSRTMTFTEFTPDDEPGISQSVSFTAHYPFDETTPDDIFSTTLVLHADASGRILIRITPSAGGAALINGLRVSHVPPQATLLLLQ